MSMQSDETKLQQEFSKVILSFTKKLIERDERMIIAPKGTQHKTLSDCLCIKDMASAEKTFMFTAVDAETEDFKLLNGIKLGQTEIGKLIINKLSKIVRKYRIKYKGDNILFYFKVQQIILHTKQNGNRSIRLQGKFQVYKMNGTYQQQFQIYKTMLEQKKQQKKKIVQIDDDQQQSHKIIFKEADQEEDFEKTETNRSQSQRDISMTNDDESSGKIMKKNNKNRKISIINNQKNNRKRDQQSDSSYDHSKNMDVYHYQTYDNQNNSVSKSKTHSEFGKKSRNSRSNSNYQQPQSNQELIVQHSNRTNTQLSSENSKSIIQVSSVSSFTISQEHKTINTIEEHSEPLPNIQNQWSSSRTLNDQDRMCNQSNHSDIANTTQIGCSSSNSQGESSNSSMNSDSSSLQSSSSQSINSQSMDIEQPISNEMNDQQEHFSKQSNNQSQISSINQSEISESSLKSSTTNGGNSVKLRKQIEKTQKILLNNLPIFS